MNFKFPKSEKLISEKEIDNLFSNGNRMTVFPFKVLWINNTRSTHQLLISCPKRKLKKAVDRNLIKRRMREAYRLNKQVLYGQNHKDITYFNIAFVYIGNETMDSTVIHEKMKLAIDKLNAELYNNE